MHHNGNHVSVKAHRRLELFQQVLQKIIFSQLHFENAGLTEHEGRFLSALADIAIPNQKKIFASIIKATVNTKLTDYA